MPSRYFEDFTVGDEWTFGPWALDEAAIVAFAERYDPQVMHTDPVASASGPYGGLIASGWQTALACITPFLDAVMRDTAGLASPGFESFRWRKPVRPGDEIRPLVRILDTRRSASKPDRGIVRLLFAGLDATGEAVWEAEGIFFISCRA
ncbi:MAG: MaoC family dehydratase [Rhodospirillaceae bacterium]